ncbi:hypothetical protein ACLI1C_04720 [Devosia sp. XGJD_8]|uniref:COG3904 family protein n=1 Tax=Devosia sp. XGJD_8 TaxID=3391187 RepID=UPI00398561B3
MLVRKSLVTSAALLLSASTALAEVENFGPFLIDTVNPTTAVLVGTIDQNAPLDFRRLMREYPTVETLALASNGGDVTAALLIAQEVALLGFKTYVPEADGCYSACAFIFFAGDERVVLGELGVHQVSGTIPDDYSTQVAVADILDNLSTFGVPDRVLLEMLRTPPQSMKIYTSDDAQSLGINRRAVADASAPVQAVPAPEVVATPEISAATNAPSMAKVSSIDYVEGGGIWTEWEYQVHQPAQLHGWFSAMGLPRDNIDAFIGLLRQRVGSETVPAWSKAWVLTWPVNEGGREIRVAARVSLYVPRASDGLLLHGITVEMDSRGVFIEVPEPPLE